jgi:O-antigen/teichoic acid export membrane protein
MNSWVATLKALCARVSWRDQHTRNVLSFITCRIVALSLFAVSVSHFVRSSVGTQYGTIALLFSVFSYISLLDLGIGYAVNYRFAKALARGRHDLGYIVSTAMPLFLAVGLTFTAIVFAAGRQISTVLFGTALHATAIEALSITAVLVLTSSVLTGVVQAYNRVDLVNLSSFTLDLSKAAALIVAANSRHAVLVAMWVIVVGMILKAIFDLFSFRWVTGGVASVIPKLDKRELRINLNFGAPMAMTSLVSVAYWTADRVYVSRAFGPEALTSYSIGADVCSKAFFLVYAVTRAVYTLLIRRRAMRVDSRILQKISIAAVVGVAVVFYLPLFAFAPRLLSVWVGHAAAIKSAAVTRISSVGAVAYLAMIVYDNYLQAAGRARTLLLINTAMTICMISAFVIMPRAWGNEGVATIVCFTFIIQALTVRALAERVRSLEPVGLAM